MKKWNFLNNPFSKKEKRNYKLLLSLATNHVDALNANQNVPEISQLISRTKPLLDAYNAEMQEKMTSKSISSGYVVSFYQLLGQLPAKLSRWDIEIQNQYPENTLEYRTIFGSKRSEIYRGTAEQVLNKLQSFRQKVEDTAGLDVIANNIKTFITQLEDARNAKGQKLEIYDQKQDTLAEKYDKLGIMLYRNLGKLIDIYAHNTDEIERYFNLSLLRKSRTNHNSKQQGYKLTIPPSSSRVADISFSPDDSLLIANFGQSEVKYYSAPAIDAAKPANMHSVQPNEETEVTALQLGAPANKFLIFVNENNSENAEVEIILL